MKPARGIHAIEEIKLKVGEILPKISFNLSENFPDIFFSHKIQIN